MRFIFCNLSAQKVLFHMKVIVLFQGMIWKIQISSFFVAWFCISWYKRFGQIPKENKGNLASFLGFGIVSGTEQ